MSFENNIKEWVIIDNEIKKLNELLNLKLEKKRNILKNILEYKDRKNLDNTTIKISDGTLKLNKIKQYKPITYKFLKDCLVDLIEDVKELENIFNHIKNKREYKIVEDIKRIYL
tara:strand:- start:396 stop:737 length:342 start_codon:yes stop_codon:yes gene_type:complete